MITFDEPRSPWECDAKERQVGSSLAKSLNTSVRLELA